MRRLVAAILWALVLIALPAMGVTIINADTTWHAGQSITLTDNVQVAPGVTLTLEPGVSINGNRNGIELFGGTLRAQGTSAAPIHIKDAIIALGSDTTESHILFDYVTMSGGSFAAAGGNHGYGYFDVIKSHFSGVTGFYLVYPTRDSRIESNTFDSCDGLDIALNNDVHFLIQNNVFTRTGAITNFAQYGASELVVRFNSFLNSNMVALQIASGYSSAAMTATDNYFGTTDRNIVDAMVLDRLDSLNRFSVIPIDPILGAPHPDTPPVEALTVGGAVSGLPGLTGILTLQNNAGDNLAMNFDGKFTFETALSRGDGYVVTVLSQPIGQTCRVANGSGTIAAGNVTNVAVTCVTSPVSTFTVGGAVSGLAGSITLRNNAGDDLVRNTDGSFTFAAALPIGGAYAVSVFSQPARQTCTVANGSDVIVSANVTHVAVTCVTKAGSTMVIPLVARTTSYTSKITVRNPFSDMTLPISVSYTGSSITSAAGRRACAPLSVPPLGAVQFSAAEQCNLPSGNQFGYVTLTESAAVPSPFQAYSRTQTPGGNGFSVPAYPISAIEAPEFGHYVLGLERQAATPIYQSNCFVASMDAATPYQIRLLDSTGNQIGNTVVGFLEAHQMVRYLDIFAAAGIAAGDISNASADFSNGTSTVALVGFCTVQETTFFGADFRMAQPPKEWRYEPQ
jgi:hypothetical protein